MPLTRVRLSSRAVPDPAATSEPISPPSRSIRLFSIVSAGRQSLEKPRPVRST